VDYPGTLDYLFGLQRFGVKLGLDNIRMLLDRLGHPQRSYGAVHVGGSNGKGSTAAVLAEILIRAGHRVGLYTSPHLHSFTERIRINGLPIPEDEVIRLTTEIRDLGTGVPATFFEFTTAMALEYFRCQEVTIAVVEVGLGGRLDATNALDPWVCVISSICLDHGEHLGRDLAAVANEKAGIIKPTVPVICAAQEKSAQAVLEEKANAHEVPLFCFGRDFSAVRREAGFDYHGLDLGLPGLRPGLSGEHQWENISLALAAAELLRRRGVAIPEEAMRHGVADVRWPGRLEWWPDRVLLDGAHNGGGARALADYLRTLMPARIFWVVGMKDDKNVTEILAPLGSQVHTLYCTEPPVESPCPADRVARQAEGLGLSTVIFPDPVTAFTAAVKERSGEDIILVAGSLFLVGVVRAHLLDHGGRG